MLRSDSAYQGVMDKISKIQAYGLTHKLSIPTMAIIGDQSSGKSSVLEAITKLSFPRNKGMCTRFATQVTLRRDHTLQGDVVSARIEGKPDFNERFIIVKPPATFQSVIEEAVALLCTDGRPISEEVLEITVSGPTHPPLIIVDLPGFVRITLDNEAPDLPDTIRRINQKYIQNPRTIILAVVNAENDVNTSAALAEANQNDPGGERTIPIVTKIDRIENGLHTDWVEVLNNRRKFMRLGYLTMRNAAFEEKSSMSWDQAREEEDKVFSSELWSGVDSSRKGREAVRMRLSNVLYEHISKELPALKREIDTAVEKSKAELEAMGAPILTNEGARDKLFQASMLLQPQVGAFLRADYDYHYIATFKDVPIPESDLDPLFVRASLQRLYYKYRSVLVKKCDHLTSEEIQRLISRYKANDLPGFVSFTIFKNIIKGHYLPDWEKITLEHVSGMHDHLSDALKSFITHISDGAARDVFTLIFDRFSRNKAKLFKEVISDIFKDEANPFTLSRHYLEIIDVERSKIKGSPKLSREPSISETNRVGMQSAQTSSKPPQPLQNGSNNPSHAQQNGSYNSQPPQQNGAFGSLQALQNGSFSPQQQNGLLGSHQQNGLLGSQQQNGSNHPIQSQETEVSPSRQLSETTWDDAHTTSEMGPCLVAYIRASCDRIIDKVLMETIERHMIANIVDYFQMITMITTGELDCMIESPTCKSQRKDLETKIADFEEILLSI